MNSAKPKVLHTLCGAPMVSYPLDAALALKPEKVVVVTGRDPEAIRQALPPHKRVVFAVQKEPRGTAHALASALPSLRGFKGTALVLNGDTPLISPSTLRKFLAFHRKGRSAISILSFRASDPSSYGRIIRDAEGAPMAVVEDRDATRAQKAVSEVNSGVYALEPETLALVSRVRKNRRKGEYYLTDLLHMAVGEGLPAAVYQAALEEEFLGVNTRKDMALALRAIVRRQVQRWIERGVSFIEPEAVYIEPTVRIGADTLIFPNVFLQGRTKVGRSCTIYPNVRVADSSIKDGAVVKDSSVIEESTVGRNAQVGPFARLRPGSAIGDSARIGNFVEVKKSSIGAGSKAMHLSYIGDSMVGSRVNIGAGTITCNYDGRKKYRTVIKDGVFVGSDTQFVAPVKVGKGAYIGAGSTITEDVPADALAISRTRQRNIRGWSKRRK